MHKHEMEADSIWTIPGERYKTKQDHTVPLSAAAQALIGPKLTGYVFTSGAAPFQDFSRCKRELDKAIAVIRNRDGRAPMADWTYHDLRRTSRTLLSRAGVDADVAERCLGHIIPGVRSVYDRHSFLTEKAVAFEKLAALVGEIIQS